MKKDREIKCYAESITNTTTPILTKKAPASQNKNKKNKMARVTGLEPATSGVTGQHSNQLSYTRASFLKPIHNWHKRSCKVFIRLCQAVLSVFFKNKTNNAFIFALCLFLRFYPCVFKKNSLVECSSSCRLQYWAISSAGRAPRLHRGCREFESLIAHHYLLSHINFRFYLCI